VQDFQTNLAWDTLLAPLRADGAAGSGAGPLHRQLAAQLREAVRDQRIPAGAALPPSRLLATDLGCSRWVVTEAYGQLVAEGYLEARTGSATRVSRLAAAPEQDGAPDAAPGRAAVAAALAAAPLPPAPPMPSVPRRMLDLMPGVPDLGAFPRRGWADALGGALAGMSAAEFGTRHRAGHPRLRRVLAEHLRRVRGAQAGERDVVVCRGVADGVAVVLEAVAHSGQRRVGVEEPCWAQVLQAADRAGLACVPIPVDERGLRVAELDAYPDLRTVVVSPAHQFPTGAVLEPERRAALVRWAERVDGLILEDDYDSEFRYDRAPIGVLQGVAPAHVVLHGSVSKTLSPALGLGWLVVPPAWSGPVQARLAPFAAPAVPDQLALAALLASGAYDRQLRRVRRRYRARRAALIEALHTRLPAGARTTGADAGLHLVARLDAPADPGWSVRIVHAAAELGLSVSPLDFHRVGPAGPEQALVIGYGNLPDHAVGRAASLLRVALTAAAG
jgi:GntR family transcriptional regulator/MocR family aminotransferase